MILAFRYKLRPTAAQHRLLVERLDRQSVLYNAALQERIDAWRLGQKSITRLDQQKSLTVVRADDPDGHGSDPVKMGRWTLKRVDDAMQGFFRRVKHGGTPGFPRFRAKSRWSSFGLDEWSGARIERGRVFIKGMDRGIRANFDRPLPADARITTATFTNKHGAWWVSFIVDTQEGVATEHAGTAVGIDVGIEVLATLSDGTRIPNTRLRSARVREIRVSQRALARCQKGSNRRRKVKARLARQLQSVTNARETELHRVSSRVAQDHSFIAMEKLSIANMSRSAAGTVEDPGTQVAQKRGLNREIQNASWGRLAQMVRYKAERAGGVFIQVDPRNTSQMCSGCGVKVTKKLSERHHQCGACGTELHRDHNAAINILNRGLAVHAASERGQPLGDANVGHWPVRRPGTLLAA